ncbi:Ohr family peroxiredoxin [[Mycoplasma] testudinis]|uniref:Ohr family peroxiredoxin n=1 Tax=[Mycoplasma] testudinis TaxID=33924 RepID=UPI0004806BD4|nr:Ohr family peroxiredoxin [[Mycoplasma] testudinis]
MSKAYEVSAIAKAGREGLVETTEGSLSLYLASPMAIGKKTEKNNPEQLFSAAYASCFSQAMAIVSKNAGFELKETPIKSTVELHADKETGFNIYAGIEATLPTDIPHAKAVEIVKASHAMCPFSKLIKADHFLFLKVNGVKIG